MIDYQTRGTVKTRMPQGDDDDGGLWANCIINGQTH
jgi:hypothetical protein